MKQIKYLINNNILMQEYNYKKNENFDLNKITIGSSKKIWWKCVKCGNEWQATPKNRFKGTGCPKCSLKKISSHRIKTIIEKNGSLFENRPDLVAEWDEKKNAPLTPKDVTCGSGKKVWWICNKGHSWQATINDRTSGSNCIYCTKQKPIIGENDLRTTNPELLKEWDKEKNGNLKPENFMAKSNKKVWWKCELGHSWQASISHRTAGTGCSHCYSENGTSFPEQAICYYLSAIACVKNREKIDNQEIDIYLPEYKIGFEYDGSYYHDNSKSIEKEKIKNKIISNNGITLYHIKESNVNEFNKSKKIIYCIIDKDYKYIETILFHIQEILNKKIKNIDIVKDASNIYSQYIKSVKQNNFSIYHPELLKEWNDEKNNELKPENFLIGSNKKVWWKCSKCHSEWQATINHRVTGTGCPYCSGKIINETNNLKSKFPKIAKTWDYEKNNGLSPEKIYFRSRKKVWWKCSNCQKSFIAPICSRIRSKTLYCQECMHKHIGEMNRNNALHKGASLNETRPDLVKEWNKEKNAPLTPKDFTCGSGKKVWWKCSKCGYEWQATIYNRNYGTGCPKCRK